MSFVPKHQRKVNEVYPSKVGEEGPMPGKLSALAYYLNSRPPKVPKVMLYLSKKVEKDLQRERFGFCKISLDILDNLLSHCPTLFEFYNVSLVEILYQLLSAADTGTIVKATSTVSFHFDFCLFFSNFLFCLARLCFFSLSTTVYY